MRKKDMLQEYIIGYRWDLLTGSYDRDQVQIDGAYRKLTLPSGKLLHVFLRYQHGPRECYQYMIHVTDGESEDISKLIEDRTSSYPYIEIRFSDMFRERSEFDSFKLLKTKMFKAMQRKLSAVDMEYVLQLEKSPDGQELKYSGFPLTPMLAYSWDWFAYWPESGALRLMAKSESCAPHDKEGRRKGVSGITVGLNVYSEEPVATVQFSYTIFGLDRHVSVVPVPGVSFRKDYVAFMTDIPDMIRDFLSVSSYRKGHKWHLMPQNSESVYRIRPMYGIPGLCDMMPFRLDDCVWTEGFYDRNRDFETRKMRLKNIVRLTTGDAQHDDLLLQVVRMGSRYAYNAAVVRGTRVETRFIFPPFCSDNPQEAETRIIRDLMDADISARAMTIRREYSPVFRQYTPACYLPADDWKWDVIRKYSNAKLGEVIARYILYPKKDDGVIDRSFSVGVRFYISPGNWAERYVFEVYDGMSEADGSREPLQESNHYMLSLDDFDQKLQKWLQIISREYGVYTVISRNEIPSIRESDLLTRLADGETGEYWEEERDLLKRMGRVAFAPVPMENIEQIVSYDEPIS